MKPSILISFFFFLFTCQVIGQSPVAAKAAKATKEMSKLLNLSPEQVEKVSTAFLNMYRGLEEQKDEKSIVAKDKLKVIRQDFNKVMSSTLDETQFAKYKESGKASKNPNLRISNKTTMTTEDRTKIAAQRKADRMAIKFKLSEEQKEQVFDAYFVKMTKTVALRPLAKKDPEAAKLERGKLEKEIQKTLNNILTEEQRGEFAAYKKRRKSNLKKSTMGQTRTFEMADQSTALATTEADRVALKLELDEEEKKAYKSAVLNRFRAIDHLRHNNKNKTANERAAIRVEINKKFEEQIAKFLSKKQLALLKEKATE